MRANAQVSKHYVTFSISREPITRYARYTRLAFRTLGGDGDPLDVLVLTTEPLIPGILVECRPIGMIVMVDDGEQDEKIIAVAKGDPFFANVKNMDDLPKHTFDEMVHFFKRYKELQNKVTEIKSVEGIEAALKVIDDSLINYAAEYDRN